MDTAWMHSKRLNRAKGARSEAEVQAELNEWEARTKPPERKLPSDLDERAFAHRVGFEKDDEHDPALTRAKAAYHQYGERLRDWKRREAIIYSDRFELPQKKAINVSKMVHREMQNGLDEADRAYKSVTATMSEIDKDIDKAFKHKVEREMGQEIRGHVKSMTARKRREFLSEADEETLSAVLAAKPFLSGMSQAEADALRHQTVNRLFPAEVKRRAKLEKASEQIESAQSRYLGMATEFISPDLDEFDRIKSKVDAAVKGEA